MNKSSLLNSVLRSFVCGLAFAAPFVLASSINFPDVSTSDWFYRDVQNMVNWGVIQGNDDGTFAPGRGVNRAELSAMWNRYTDYLRTQFAPTGSSMEAFMPNRDEWVELMITKEIESTISGWQNRYSLMVWVRDGAVTITASNANGEPPISDPSSVESTISNVARGVMDRYPWTKNYSLYVQAI